MHSINFLTFDWSKRDWKQREDGGGVFVGEERELGCSPAPLTLGVVGVDNTVTLATDITSPIGFG